ncbi:hypothetical protein [Bifidobacterium stellenboschense]|uniref:Uncharacterized protein n=1 Tax=Bifidobacterium stellenboschense TaxID=762211 RepID=A0A087DQM4_9BIFI|nr:hypothetical protein [Bifidobacterium stellenboschense]KFI97824.1 hypothetical protein BSTEL_0635 [Bifidobacterium stellenboschense]
MPVRTCAHCGKPLDPNQSAKAKYCSASCRVLACRERRKHGTPPKRKPEPKPEPAPQLNSRDFDRMMDGSIEDDLRHARDRLKQYLDDPATPANAISNIVARYVAVCEKLHDMAGGDDLLADLTDDTSEVNADAGTSIV